MTVEQGTVICALLGSITVSAFVTTMIVVRIYYKLK